MVARELGCSSTSTTLSSSSPAASNACRTGGCTACQAYFRWTKLTQTYSDSAGSCNSYSGALSTYDGTLAITHELSPSDLPAIELISLGEGRLRTLNLGHNGALLLEPGRWTYSFADEVSYLPHAAFYDSVFGVECSPMRVDGGDIRCVPGFTEGTSGFAGSACTEPLIAEYSTCSPSEFRGVVSPDRCTVTELHRRAAEYTGPLSGGGEGCADLGTTSAGGPAVYRTERLPLDQFALLESVR